MKKIIPCLLLLITGILLGYFGRDILQRVRPNTPKNIPSKEAKKERKPLFYRNPMNPSITSPVPAKDEMGMDYIPVYPEDLEGGSSKNPGTVKIDPVTIQKIGVRTAKVEMRPLYKEITTYAIVAPDEDRLYRVNVQFSGWAEKMVVKKTGQRVKKGEILLYVYSPQVLTAEDELLLSLKNLDSVKNGPKELLEDAKRLYEASRKRLLLLGVPKWFVSDIERTRKKRRLVPVTSPSSGFITKVNIRPNGFLSPKSNLYELADLTTVWIYAYFFEDELPWIKEGEMVDISIKGLKDKRIVGKIDYIYPRVDKRTRTIKTRIVIKNSDFSIRPGMYAQVILKAGSGRKVVAIPREAVLRTGKSEHVFVALGDGKFEPRRVVLGIQSDELIEVKKGLRPGEEIVVSGQFLIDSESSLKEAALKMMEPKKEKKKTMKGMKMEKMDKGQK